MAKRSGLDGGVATRLVMVCGLVASASLPGCGGSPFAHMDEDYGRVLPVERLRSIEAVDYAEYEGETLAEAAGREPVAFTRFDGMEKVSLPLERVRVETLANNLDLGAQLVAPAAAEARLTQEEAAFEGVFTLSGRYDEIDNAVASELSNAQAENINVVPGVRIPLRTGGTASVQLPMNRNKNNNEFTTLNPAYSSDLEFSISQPLLRNAGRRASTFGIRVASYDRQISEAQTKLEAIRQLAAADRSYWRLYAARGELDVRQQQYELAVAQLERANRLFEQGRAAEVERIRSQSGVADSLEGIIVAENEVLRQQRELKRIMNAEGLGIKTDTLIETESAPDPVRYLFDTDELIAQALDTRMEMLELELQLARDAATIEFNENQALPLVTLDYTYRINGLGSSLGRATEVMVENEFEGWSLGLNAEVPIGNQEAKSRVRASILDRLQRLRTREARAQAISQEVLDAIDTLDSAWQRVLAARQSVILNTRLLEAEQRQFNVGRSTSTDVLDASSLLGTAQSSEVRALSDYQIAQVDLAFASGTLLGAARVDWDPVPVDDALLEDAKNAPSERVARASLPIE